MKRFWKKVDLANRRLIPYALILLVIVIVLELFFHIENLAVERGLQIIDYLILAVFIIDLIFLAIKARTVRFFFRHYWLDLLAVFPFGLVFAIFSEIFRGLAALEGITLGQRIFHESLELEKEAKLISKEGKIVRELRFVPRLLRLIFKSHLFRNFEKTYFGKKWSQ